MNNIIKLENRNISSNKKIGGKASNLIKLSQFPNINTPTGFVIPVEVFEKEFNDNKLSKKLIDEILCISEELFGNSLVAVRSSAISEDLTDKSFAGQYESILNVSKENMIESIISVHLSSIKIKDYFLEDKNETAVIVQQMVKAEISGILFSKNPMNDSESIIEYVNSLGDKLASGQISGEGRLTIDRKTFWEKNKIDNEEAIKNKLFKELFSIGFQLEKELGYYCDIEWAVENAKIYILQVRPITTLGILKTFFGEEKPFDSWTNGNVREVLPEKMTPLSWSMFGELINQLLRDSFQFLPDRYGTESTCFIRLEGNKLLYNVGAVNHFTNEILGFPTMNAVIGGNHFSNNGEIDNLKLNWRKIISHAPTVLKNNSMYESLPKISDEKKIYIQDTARTYGEKNLTTLSIDELLYELDGLTKIIEEMMFLHTFATSASFSFVNLLDLILLKNGLNKDISIDLLSNIDGIKILELNVEILQLVHEIKIEKLENQVAKQLEKHNWKELLDENGLSEINEKISSIINKFGHRGSSELELSIPTWGENPRILIKAILNYLNADVKVFETSNEIYEEALKKFDDKLKKNKLTYPLAKKLLEQARNYTRLRENNKHYLYLLIAQLRRLINEIKERIPLAYQEYFYMFTFSELKEFLTKRLSVDLHQLNIRKQLLDTEIDRQQAENTYQTNSLEGIVVSAGYVKGYVKVLKSVNEIDLLEKNDILVTESIDIGWLPIFQKIGGLVTEIGGVLSHGSIIAREFGLPAIVNVEGASTILKDGEEVILDAHKGILYRTT